LPKQYFSRALESKILVVHQVRRRVSPMKPAYQSHLLQPDEFCSFSPSKLADAEAKLQKAREKWTN